MTARLQSLLSGLAGASTALGVGGWLLSESLYNVDGGATRGERACCQCHVFLSWEAASFTLPVWDPREQCCNTTRATPGGDPRRLIPRPRPRQSRRQ